MSTNLASEKKFLKRRLVSSSKITGEEFTKKILLLTIENLIPFEKVESTYFRNFIINYNNFDSSTNFIPDSEILLHLSRELYTDFLEYYSHFFSTRCCRVNLTFHKWFPLGEIHPYVFINLHYVDDDFRLCEISLGLVEMKLNNLINFLIGNVILKCCKEKINFITSNFRFDQKSMETLRFITGENDIEKKILICLPKLLNEAVVGFYVELAKEWDLQIVNNNQFNTEDMIPNLILCMLECEMDKFAIVSLEDLLPLPEDKDSSYFDLLNKWLRNQKSLVLPYLSGLLFYKDTVKELIKVQRIDIKESSWEFISFVESISKPFYDIILSCSSVHPVSHMALKWLKILIIQVNTIDKEINNKALNIDSSKNSTTIEKCLTNLVQKLKSIHDNLESRPDLRIASYLHPPTKRYLKEEHLGSINQLVADLSKTSKQQRINPDCMDDIIMQMFDCSGKATKECYNYETSATSEVKYIKESPYLTKESGPYILQFWNKNSSKYVNLTSLARSNLSIQITSDNNLCSFKNCFNGLKADDLCDLEVIYFLHGLCKTLDLLLFNPKELDLNMREYRFDYQYSMESSNSSYYDLEGISEIVEKRLRKLDS